MERILVVWYIFICMIIQKCLHATLISDRCDSVAKQERLECGHSSVTSGQCLEKQCCFDYYNGQCFYPASCNRLITVAGGYSALLILPSQDPNHQGMSTSALTAGDWCHREISYHHPPVSVNMDLEELRLLHVIRTARRDMSDPNPINFTYTQSIGGVNRKMISFAQKNTSNLLNRETISIHATSIRLTPIAKRINACIHITVVSCPPTEFPLTTDAFQTTPMETTKHDASGTTNLAVSTNSEHRSTHVFPTTNSQRTTRRSETTESTRLPFTEPPTTSTPPTEKPTYSYFTSESDRRPSAIVVGTFAIFIVIGEVVCIVLLDAPTLCMHFRFMCSNISSYIRHRKHQAPLHRHHRTVLLSNGHRRGCARGCSRGCTRGFRGMRNIRGRGLLRPNDNVAPTMYPKHQTADMKTELEINSESVTSLKPVNETNL